MTVFDLVVIAVVTISALLAFIRGLVREVIALATWIVALILAFLYAGDLAGLFTGVQWSPAVMQVIAFAVVFIGVLIAGGLIAVILSPVLRPARSAAESLRTFPTSGSMDMANPANPATP